MKTSKTKKLKSEIKNVLRCMDFVSKNFLSSINREDKVSSRYYDIYQNLGLAWEYISLQCGHNEGYKKIKDGKEACTICGKIKNAPESHYLLAVKGGKKIGNKAYPNSKIIFKTKKDAEIVNDTISFHGSHINVNVGNAYESALFRGKHKITVADDRSVTVHEDGVECNINQHTISLSTGKKPKKPLYGGFPWELRKSILKHFPVIFEYDNKYRLGGLTIIRESKKKRRT